MRHQVSIGSARVAGVARTRGGAPTDFPRGTLGAVEADRLHPARVERSPALFYVNFFYRQSLLSISIFRLLALFRSAE